VSSVIAGRMRSGDCGDCVMLLTSCTVDIHLPFSLFVVCVDGCCISCWRMTDVVEVGGLELPDYCRTWVWRQPVLDFGWKTRITLIRYLSKLRDLRRRVKQTSQTGVFTT
jgi:hypothetical protein